MSTRLLKLFCGVLLLIMGLATVQAMGAASDSDGERKPAYGVMEPELLDIVYAGTEKFRYEIAYTGGIKLGELDLETRPVAGREEDFELYVQVSTTS